MGWKNIPVARKTKVKHVVTFYGFEVNFLPRKEPVWKKRYLRLFQTVDKILCEGPHMADCIAALGCPPHKIQVHALGIETDAIPFRPAPPPAAGEPFKILMAGSFVEKKGFPVALEALGRLKNEVDFRVTLIGDSRGNEREEREKARIMEAIDRHQLRDRVTLLGYQPYSRFLEEARVHHLFLSPSVTAADGDTEGGAPVSVIEMAAAGLLVITSDHCDIPGIIQDGKTGLAAKEKDIDGLTRKIRWAFNQPSEWSGLQHAARRHIETSFNARIQAEKLASIYQELARA